MKRRIRHSALILERLPDAIVLADDEGHYVTANDAACRLVGATREEIESLRVGDLTDGAVAASEAREAWRTMRERGTLEGRTSLRHRATGAVIAVDFHSRANVAPGLHVTVFHPARALSDPTPRPAYLDQLAGFLEIQHAVLSTGASLAEVMQTTCDRAATIGGADGATIEIQTGDELEYRAGAGSMRRFVGFRVKREGSLSGLAVMLGRQLACEDSETDARVDREACRRVGLRSMIVVPLANEEEIVGVLKVASSRPRAFDAGDGELLRLLAGFLGAALARARVHDARVALERKEREHILELERLREEFASLIVHDLRSPLMAILVNIEILRESLSPESADALEAAVGALTAANRLDGLLRTLLEVARLEQGQIPLALGDVSLGALFDEVRAERAQALRARDVSFAVRLAGDLAIRADAALLRRVVDNVVDNALRHVAKGGRVEIAARASETQLEIRIGNSGPPVPEEARARVFEKFGQAASRGRTTFGLGLYFCRLVLEAHGGGIRLESEGELPAVFVLSLPVRSSERPS